MGVRILASRKLMANLPRHQVQQHLFTRPRYASYRVGLVNYLVDTRH
jgi:hypothetical protein